MSQRVTAGNADGRQVIKLAPLAFEMLLAALAIPASLAPPLLCNAPPPPKQFDYNLDATLAYTMVSLFFFAPMGAFVAGALSLCYKGWADDQKERRRVSNFMGVAQFYEFEPRKVVLLSKDIHKQIYEVQPQDLDSAGEPIALTGERLYPPHVSAGAPSPPRADNTLGAGRLQRLWLMRGAKGAGNATRVCEQRLQRRVAERAQASPLSPHGMEGSDHHTGAPKKKCSAPFTDRTSKSGAAYSKLTDLSEAPAQDSNECASSAVPGAGAIS
ncbi:MAG: hypothetical protein SGPRY_000851 [Prymnesium sp.]